MHSQAEYSIHALAADTATLEPGHWLNANLRNQGAGLVPPVVAIVYSQRRATVVAAAVRARIDVPFGWHALDDGRRLLVFDPCGEVQINFNVLPRDDRSAEDFLDLLENEARGSYPHPECVRFREGPMHALGVHGISDGRQALEQYHFLVNGQLPETLLHVRVTSIPARSAAACSLAALMLESVVFEANTNGFVGRTRSVGALRDSSMT